MRLPAFVRNMLPVRPPTPQEVERVVDDAKPWGLRRWESAKTNRLNKGQWSGAYDQSINADMGIDLPTLRARCHYEVQNNTEVKGVVETYVVDLVGQNGPDLQIQCNDDAYSEGAEAVWRKWWNGKPCLDGRSGPDALKMWVRSMWPEGAWLIQMVSDPSKKGKEVGLGLNTIATRRLDMASTAANVKAVLGIEVDEYLRPLKYYIGEESAQYGGMVASTEPTPIDTEHIIHQFIPEEPGQLRGVPWLASALQDIADLREYDQEVLAAAKNCARQTGVWECLDPNGERWVPLPAGSSMEIKRDAFMAGPPGWHLNGINPTQPAAQYVDFRKERQRALGRAVSMPLMIIRLDSSNHNYSSARFDDQTYKCALDSFRGDVERVTLNVLADKVLREAELLGIIPPRPSDVQFIWTWPARPEVDSAKEGEGQTIRMENLTLPFAMACQRYGLTEDQVIASWVRTNKKLKTAGLPLLQHPDNTVIADAKARTAKDAVAAAVAAKEKTGNA